MPSQQLSHDDLERVVRRRRGNHDRDIAYLLGDPQRDVPITVEDWVVAAEQARATRYDGGQSGQFSLMDMCFEPACALLHDARLHEALQAFRTILVPEHRGSTTKVLAALGSGRVQNMWRRYAGAETTLARALQDAEKLGDATLLVVARSLWALNRSDAGNDVAIEPLYELAID